MRVLVTRPEPDGLKLKGLLEERGHEATVEPLMRVAMEDQIDIDLEGIGALIATSRNALRALRFHPALPLARGLRLYVVGAGTAEEARNLGFEEIVKGPGTAGDLAPVIASTLDPASEILLHLRGEKIAGQLSQDLEALGFRVVETVVYRMRAAQGLSAGVQWQISRRELDAVLLMSPQTAAIYRRLIVKHDLSAAVGNMVHLCLSEAVAARLGGLGAIPIEIAAAPSLQEMLALTDLAHAQLGRD